MPIIIVLAVLGALLLLGVATYNGLIKTRNRVDEAWSDITVQLKRRYDLIPNLVNTVQGYAKHEKEVFTKITEARTNAMSATNSGPAAVAQAEGGFASAMKSLFAVAEAYPDLKANQNFLDLQAQLTDTEDKIQASRRFYNGAVRDFNTKCQVFPTNLFANMLGFKIREFFEVDEAERATVEKPVEVKF